MINDYTDIEVPLVDHSNKVHVVHYIGIDGKDIRVCVSFSADDDCTVTVGTAPGMTASIQLMEYAEEDAHTQTP